MGTRTKTLGIYSLLIVTGVYISAQIYYSGRNIQHVTNDLLSANVPLLANLNKIKLCLAELERTFYEYHATVDRGAMILQRQHTLPTMEAAIASVQALAPGDSRIQQAQSHITLLVRLTERLDETMMARSINWELAQLLLLKITEQGRQAVPLINEIETDFRAKLLSTSDIVKDTTDYTTQLVLAFCALAVMLAGLVSFYLERFMRLAADHSYLAYHDPLTRLPNRQHFEMETQGQSPSHRIGLLGLIKLDRFNLVTAGQGLAVGDEIIQAAARRIQSLLPEGAQLYRFESASFAITLPFVPQNSWFDLLLQSFDRALKLHSTEFYLSLSLGYCVVPDDGEDYQTLIKNADACLSRVSNQGGNAYRRYSPDLLQLEQAWFTLENELREAIVEQQFSLHYQPQVDAHSMELVGMEALLRWHNPSRGPIAPGTFIPLAEQTGLIVKIGAWVLNAACRQALYWHRTYGSQCVVAINISPKQFMHPDFVQGVAEALTETGVPPHLIELEITEGVMVENTEQSINTLKQLKNLGLQLSIDDFGTGYSSLVYLKRFPIDKLKIDQAFVRNLDKDEDKQKRNEAIVRTIVDMAQNLSLGVIAEGVETGEQQGKLQAIGCNELQGYLISKPKPPLELTEFFAPAMDTDWTTQAETSET